MGSILLGFTLASMIINRQTKGFIFNKNYNVPLDVMYQIQLLLIPVLLFCISNWAITTLHDGKGSFRDIFLVVCYSLVPFAIFNLISPFLSNSLSLNDAAYLAAFDAIGYVWSGLMIFVGIKEIHEYSIGKMVSTLFLTAASALIIIFICLVFFSLLQELGGFMYTIFLEISLRI